ncbi:uncharacterized protein LOC107035793 isoform X2 [Diachasma alloeum]|uniref:uncharacterized protein LOC107035793 isoform X2 n=1 Tax=Diachasma alloeum TaxID=454923 RepID=UPI0007381141|nr:uncharacterized protein LOC107035793 isoform X2 [Diachasma alloeum]
MRFPAVGSRTIQFLMPVLIGSCFNMASSGQPASGQRVGPSLILDGINNVANSATNFLTGVVQRQKEILHHVADSATDYVVNAVEKPRNLLMNTALMTSNYKLGIPILEPVRLDGVYYETHNPEIGELKILLDNMTISGITSFAVDRARLSLIGPSIAMNLTFPKLYMEGDYKLAGVLGDMFTIHGAGPVTATVSDLRVYFATVLGYSRGMYLKSFDMDFNIGHIEMYLGNLMGDEKLGRVMNEVIQDVLPQALEIMKPDIVPRIQDFIASKVNDTIYHLTMRDVLSFLVGENEVRKYPHLLHP